jgi:hypothetical protein
MTKATFIENSIMILMALSLLFSQSIWFFTPYIYSNNNFLKTLDF